MGIAHERPKLSAAVDLAWATSAADLMTVEMLYTEGCPHAAAYLPHLQQLVANAGFDEPVQTRLVVDDDQAQHERFLGSPTIRVNGADVDPGAIGRQDFGLSCRLYVTLQGRRGQPPDEWVVTRLRHDGERAP